jgi:hypothetical protein
VRDEEPVTLHHLCQLELLSSFSLVEPLIPAAAAVYSTDLFTTLYIIVYDPNLVQT